MTPVAAIVAVLAYLVVALAALKLIVVWQPKARSRLGKAAGMVVFVLLVSPALDLTMRLERSCGPGARVANWMFSRRLV
jgi:uncharacterized membrane protein YqjE